MLFTGERNSDIADGEIKPDAPQEQLYDPVRELAVQAAAPVLACDFDGFGDHLDRTQDTVCGRGPLFLLLRTLSMLGGANGTQTAFDTSGNITNDCAFGNSTGETSQFVDGGSNLLASIANLVTGAVVNVPAQTNALNCTNLNVEDVIDQDSNNTTRTLTETEIEDSFNQSHHRR